jgi:class 3 adenylate cyclase/tetratricopeptide (TPR) repeat protein
VVSVLFADLVGFTARSDRSDPEDVRAALAPYHARVKREIERFGGTVEKFIGDAVMAVFGAPVAHEDDAERAVRSALRIPDAIAELNEATPGLDLAVRVAVNTGEALVTVGARPTEGESIVAGDVVNTASRLQQVAPVGGVVVGQATYRATHQLIEYEELEPVAVKGKSEPIPIWRAAQVRSRYGVDYEGVRAPLVGRQDELALLKQTFSRSLHESSVQLLTVVGEPGVGKTRLVREFFAFVDEQPDLIYWRQGRCLAYGENITFWALGEIVKAQAGILESDGPADAREKLTGAVGTVVEDQAERDWVTARLAPLVAAGSDVSAGEAGKEESFAAWRRFLEAVASFHPLVLVVEDLHWADRALLEFIDHLTEWATDVPLLLICTARPELFESSPGWGGGKRNAVTISLSPLSAEETTRLIAALLEQAVLPVETQSGLLERAGGNPLYTEEFVRMLVDRGFLQRRGRVWEVVADGDIPVPETVQALIAARLDTLPPDRKALVHDASVVGKVFWSGAIASIGGIEERAAIDGLHELSRKELVRRDRRSSVEGQAEYAFWHALIRDVAYGQIPRAQRAAKHRAAAGWIEGIGGDRVMDYAEFLAHHYGQALDLARSAGGFEPREIDLLKHQTRRFLVMAGDRAAPLDSVRALSFYERALELFPDEDPELPTVLAKTAESGFQSGRWELPEIERTYREAIELFRLRGDRVHAGEALVRLSSPVWVAAPTARAVELVTEGVELLEGTGAGPELAMGYAALAARKFLAGDVAEGLERSGRALALADKLGLPEVACRANQVRGMARCVTGDVDGLRDLREALRIGLESGLSVETSNSYVNLSFFLWSIEGPDVALTTHREAIEFSSRRGLERYRRWAIAETCWFHFDLGEWDDMLAVAAKAHEWDASRDWNIAVSALAYQALVHAHRGRLGDAAAVQEEFLDRARRIRDPQVLVPALGAAVLIERSRENPQAAVGLVEELHDAFPIDFLQPHTWFLPDAVRACVSAGAFDLADRLFPDPIPEAARYRNSVLTGRAILAEGRGDAAEASRLYGEASRRWAAYGHKLERGQALLGLGRCLAGMGELAEAMTSLRGAREAFVDLGARPLLEETDDWLQRATQRSS